jgi:nucleoside-diphosphate-sugar epimerase
METKHVLVTGAGGFLGSYIVKELLERGYKVTGLARNVYPELVSLGVEFVKCDLSVKEEVEQLDLGSFDGLIHTAALAGVWGSYQRYETINYLGTIYLYERAKACGLKNIVYTSSPSVVFGEDDIVDGDETLNYPEKYYTHYAKTKAMAEEYILAHSIDDQLNTVSLRPHLIWGPGDPHLIPRVLEKAKKGKLKIVGRGDNLVDIIHVRNAALAHVQALETLFKTDEFNGESYFIGQERPVNLWDFLNSVLALKGLPLITQEVNFNLAFHLGHGFELLFKLVGIERPEPPMTRFVALQLAKSHYFKHDKAKRDFGYEPKVSIEQGLKDLFISETSVQ